MAGNPLLPLHLMRQQTRLGHARGDLDQAQARAEAGIVLGEQALTESVAADPATRAELRTALARLLQLAGTIAEELSQPEVAAAAVTRAISLLVLDLSRLAAETQAAYAELLTARGEHAATARHYQTALRDERQRCSGIRPSYKRASVISACRPPLAKHRHSYRGPEDRG